MMENMNTGKGLHKFNTLTSRDMGTVQQAHLKEQFELAEQSVLTEDYDCKKEQAEAMVTRNLSSKWL